MSADRIAIILLGHSHASAVKEAASQRTYSGEGNATLYIHDVWANRSAYADFDGGQLQFNSVVMQAINDAVPRKAKRHYVSMMGGNGHIVFALSKHPRPFDFVLPEHPSLPLEENNEVVPSDYVRKSLQPHMMPYVWQLLAFRQACGQTVTQIETPPPCGDDDYLRTHLGSYVPDPNNIVSRWLRMKCWRLHSSIMTSFCTEHDIRFLPAPSTVLDEEGFLHRDALGKDATHGNAWYGHRVLDQLENAFGVRIGAYKVFVEPAKSPSAPSSGPNPIPVLSADLNRDVNTITLAAQTNSKEDQALTQRSEDGSSQENPRDLFQALIAKEQPRPVLEIGTHQSIPGRSTLRIGWFPYLTRADYITSDVFGGEDVDEVTNIHDLPEKWTDKFGAFLCGSVFEHLDRPWIAAQQVAKILKPGGLCYIITHQCFPIHGFPSDFFRFSDQALSLIFRDAGLDILAAGYENRCTINPPAHLVEPGIQAMWNQNHPSYIHVHLVARKPA